MFASNAQCIIRVESFSFGSCIAKCATVGAILGVGIKHVNSNHFDSTLESGFYGAAAGAVLATFIRLAVSTPQECLDDARTDINYVKSNDLVCCSNPEKFLKRVDLFYIQDDWPLIYAFDDLNRLYKVILNAKENLADTLDYVLSSKSYNVNNSTMRDKIDSALIQATVLSKDILKKMHIIKSAPGYAKMLSNYNKFIALERRAKAAEQQARAAEDLARAQEKIARAKMYKLYGY